MLNYNGMLFFVVVFSLTACSNNLDQNQSYEESWDQPPRVVYYPSSAQFQFENEDDVQLRLLINKEGKVDSAWVEKSRGYADLDSFAVASALNMVFAPARKNGRPVAIQLVWPHTFRKDP